MAHLTLIGGINVRVGFARFKNVVMAINTALVDTIMCEIRRHPRHAGAVTRVAFAGGRYVIARLTGRRHAVMAGFTGLGNGGVVHARRHGETPRRMASITRGIGGNVTGRFAGCEGPVVTLIALPRRAAKCLINMTVFARDTLMHPVQHKPR